MNQIFQMTQIFSNQLIFFESCYAICHSEDDTKHSIDKEKQFSPGSDMPAIPVTTAGIPTKSPVEVIVHACSEETQS